jgi:membrane-bound ClpP family serine protease
VGETLDRTKRRGSTALRYAAFQLPGAVGVALLLAVLVRWFDLAPRTALLLLALWVLKDVALFRFVRRAYEARGGGGGAEALVGALGTAQERLDPEGWVRIGHERWRARVRGGSVERNAGVRVREVRGLLLVVEPAEPGERG